MILQDALSIQMHGTDVELGCNHPLLGGHTVPASCLGKVFWNTLSEIVHGAELVLGSDVALLGSFDE